MPPRPTRAKPAPKSHKSLKSPPVGEPDASITTEPATTAAAASTNDAGTSSAPTASREYQRHSGLTFKTEKASELYKTLLARNPQPNDIFAQAELSALQVASSDRELLEICQELVDLGLFQLLELGASIRYRLKSLADASRVQSLDKDARLIYNTIEAAGSSGIWTKTLKAKTNLHQTVLTRVLKSLEGKAYVKQIKNARFPGRKIYMLQNLNPTDEVTGGPFFSDGELDEGLIEYASYFIVMYVRSRSWKQGPRFKKPIKASILSRDLPHMLSSEGPNSRILLPHPAGYSDYPNAAEILTMLDGSGIFENKHFTEADLQILLDVLVFDRKLEVIPPANRASGATKAIENTAMLKRSLQDTESDADDEPPRVPMKRRKVYGLRGSPSPQPTDTRRFHQLGETTDSEAESDTGADTKYRSVWRAGPPPPRPEHIVVNTEEQASATQPETETTNDGGEPSLRQTADTQQAPSAKADTNAADSVALPQKSKERRELEQIEELLASSNAVSETPCSGCPVFRFCEEGTRIDATTCEYFPTWFDDSLDGDRRAGGLDDVQNLSQLGKAGVKATGASA